MELIKSDFQIMGVTHILVRNNRKHMIFKISGKFVVHKTSLEAANRTFIFDYNQMSTKCNSLTWEEIEKEVWTNGTFTYPAFIRLLCPSKQNNQVKVFGRKALTNNTILWCDDQHNLSIQGEFDCVNFGVLGLLYQSKPMDNSANYNIKYNFNFDSF